jgi:CheY-like chemotaxis protein
MLKATLSGSAWNDDNLEEKTMKIMIFDDSTRHQDMAKRQLTGHTLTIFGDYEKALKALERGEEKFDVVLTDLMAPTFPHDLSRAQEEMPVGLAIALLALAKGVENVAIVSDGNHHDHPGVHITDGLHGFWGKKIFNLECLHSAVSHYDEITMDKVESDYLWTDEGKTKYPEILSRDQERIIGYHGIVRGKRWDKAIKRLFPET